MEALAQACDILVIDSPPIHPVSDAAALSKFATGVVFVVEADATPKHLARRSIQALQSVNAKVLGVVLNQMDFSKVKPYYGSYAGAGDGYYTLPKIACARQNGRFAHGHGAVCVIRGEQTGEDDAAGHRGMIDLHCHLLPNIDDGPATMEEALAMARAAHEAGIHKAIVTPHLHLGRYVNDLNSIRKAMRLFSAELRRNEIPLQVNYGAEVRICAELTELVANETAPYIGEFGGKK